MEGGPLWFPYAFEVSVQRFWPPSLPCNVSCLTHTFAVSIVQVTSIFTFHSLSLSFILSLFLMLPLVHTHAKKKKQQQNTHTQIYSFVRREREGATQ